MGVTFTEFEPKYRRPDGLTSIKFDNLEMPEGFNTTEHGLVVIPPGIIGGNHKHPRKECFVGVGEGLAVVWQDDKGKNHEIPMNPAGPPRLFYVPAMVPHAVINRSDHPAVLYELADGPQENVERIVIIEH